MEGLCDAVCQDCSLQAQCGSAFPIEFAIATFSGQGQLSTAWAR